MEIISHEFSTFDVYCPPLTGSERRLVKAEIDGKKNKEREEREEGSMYRWQRYFHWVGPFVCD